MHTLICLTSTLSGLALLLGLTPAHAAFISASDMLASQWQQTAAIHVGPAVVTTGVSTSAGAPGDSKWLTTYTLAQSSSAQTTSDLLANMYVGAGSVWSPASDGAIDQLTVRFDARGLTSTFASGVTAFMRAVVEQDGVFYAPSRTSAVALIAGAADRTLSWTLDEVTDWTAFDHGVQRTAAPDLSRSGAPLRFGYAWSLGTSCPSTVGCFATRTTTVVDNLVVDVLRLPDPIATVPEPGALTLGATALLGLWGTRRRC